MRNGSAVSGLNRTNRMLYGLIFLAMFMSLSHHIEMADTEVGEMRDRTEESHKGRILRSSESTNVHSLSISPAALHWSVRR
jgi:hypothetical protein